MPSQPQLRRNSSLGYQINHLARLLERELRVRIAPHGVVPGQFAPLLALYEEDELTQRELCARVRIDPSTMAHTLKRMERDGLIRRRPDPADGRRSVVTLSDHARALEPALTRAAIEGNSLATSDMAPDAVASLLTQIANVIERLERDSSDTGSS